MDKDTFVKSRISEMDRDDLKKLSKNERARLLMHIHSQWESYQERMRGEGMKWAVSNGRVFHVTDDERQVMEARRKGRKVTEVISMTEVSAIPMDRIIGRIGEVWYVRR